MPLFGAKAEILEDGTSGAIYMHCDGLVNTK